MINIVMKRDNLFFRLLALALTFIKVGALTFGGGYAMIPIIEEEVTKKRKWVTQSEVIDVIAISESTPGPISINAATYIGYKVAGIWGAIVSTLSLALPSFIIIFIISFFYEEFLKIKAFQAMFSGLKIGVILLLINALFKLKKGVKITFVSVTLFLIALILTLAFSIFNISFNYTSLLLILFGIIVGIVCTKIGGLE